MFYNLNKFISLWMKFKYWSARTNSQFDLNIYFIDFSYIAKEKLSILSQRWLIMWQNYLWYMIMIMIYDFIIVWQHWYFPECLTNFCCAVIS